MIFIFCFLAAFSAYNTSAAPVPLLIGRQALLSAECSTNQLKRTLFGIIWSCLSTTILCAWTAVHPNVPPREKWTARWDRLKLMFWMLVAPELVLAWAVRQYFAARKIRDEYNRSHRHLPKWMRWTLVHGHMVQMGGFTLVDPDNRSFNRVERRSEVMTFDDLKRQWQNPKFPYVGVADIMDRSKGDTLFKLIGILQTTWFIIQCVARGWQGLALTELELITLALASLNGVTFGIWWYKPLGVEEPIRIYLRIGRPKVREETRQRDRILYSDVISAGWEIAKKTGPTVVKSLVHPCERGPIYTIFMFFGAVPTFLPYIITFPIFVLFPLGIILLLRIIETEPVPEQTSQERGLLAARIVASMQEFRYSSSSIVTKFVDLWLGKIFEEFGNVVRFFLVWFILLPCLFFLLLLFTIFFTPFVALLFLFSFIFTAVFGIVTTSTIHPGALHVPSFYALPTKHDRWSRMAVFALFGVIFGSVHCIGWTFEFPSHSQKALWRATSLTITIIPLIVAPIDYFLAIQFRNRDLKACYTCERIILLFLDLVMTILLFVYVPIRLSLIAQALALLQHQPSSALVAVDWTKYVPHLFSS